MAERCWSGRRTKRDGSYRLQYISQNYLKCSSTYFKSRNQMLRTPKHLRHLSTTEIHCLLPVIATNKCKTTLFAFVWVSLHIVAILTLYLFWAKFACLGAELWGSSAPCLDNLAPVLQTCEHKLLADTLEVTSVKSGWQLHCHAQFWSLSQHMLKQSQWWVPAPLSDLV